MKLKYRGRMGIPGCTADLRMWDILDPKAKFKTTVVWDELVRLGIVPAKPQMTTLSEQSNER